MKKRDWLIASLASSSALGLLIIAGCNPTNPVSDAGARNSQSTPDQQSKPGNAKVSDVQSTAAAPLESDSEHGHKAGAHGGIMVSLGRDSYHVEAVVESDGTIRLYTLGKDETRVIDVESQSLKGFVKAEGDADSKSIAFEPSPQDGDAENKTSLFVGKLPSELIGRKLDVTIPNIRIAGERFRARIARRITCDARQSSRQCRKGPLPNSRRSVHSGRCRGQWQRHSIAKVQGN
jgi:hypothetical protein